MIVSTVSVLLIALSIYAVSEETFGFSKEQVGAITTESSKHGTALSSTCGPLRRGNVTVHPVKGRYHSNEVISLICVSGYVLQKSTHKIYFENTCVNGVWKRGVETLPSCAATCREWDPRTKRWRPIHIFVTNVTEGFILSPNFPGNIDYPEGNCTFLITISSNSLAIVPVSMNLVNYLLELSSDGEVKMQLTGNSSQTPLEMAGPATISISLRRKNSATNLFGKAENFKLRYAMVPARCSRHQVSDLKVNRTTLADGSSVSETYSCTSPYTLRGPSQRVCSRGVWHPPDGPLCDFVCNSQTNLSVHSNFSIKVYPRSMVKCNLTLVAVGRTKVIKIRIKKPSWGEITFCLAIASLQASVPCAKVDKEYLVTSPAFLTRSSEEGSVQQDQIEIFIGLSPPIYCPIRIPTIRNGYFKIRERTILSTGEVICHPHYYWLASPRIMCTLNGTQAYWDIGPRQDCIKVCGERMMPVRVTRTSSEVIVPDFLRYTDEQTCKWEIISSSSKTRIIISSKEDWRAVALISVMQKSSGTTKKLYPIWKKMEEGCFIETFTCPELACILDIHPLTFASAETKFSIKVIVKPDATVTDAGNNHALWMSALLILLVTATVSTLSFVDYWRHPYTGYTAKFLHVFTNWHMKKLSSIFVFEARPSQNHTKTQSNIIIFFNTYHPSSRNVGIRRSCPSRDSKELPPSSWRYRFSSIRRRFSDITDLVLFSCTVGSPKGETNPQPPEEGTAVAEATE